MSEKSLIQDLLNDIEANLDNPEWLSAACVKLSNALFAHNTAMADAELEEKRKVVGYLASTGTDRKMTVSESEKRGVVDTNNEYGRLKAQGEALIESINAIKARIKVLSWERNNSGGLDA